MGTFVINNLLSGEQVVFQAKVSWMSQIWYFAFAVLIVLFSPLIAVVLATIAVLRVFNTEFAVTNKKIVGKCGLIRRSTIDLPLKSLESINIDQGIIGRIFNYGSVSVRGVGGNFVTIPYIHDPFAARKFVMQSIDV